MRSNVMEVVVGAVVLIVAAVFLVFAYQSSKWQRGEGYALYGNFDKIDGLSVGSDVRISGVKVGIVSEITLNPQNFLAQAKLLLGKATEIPEDSRAEIVGEGLFGPKYLSIVPGSSDHVVAKEGTIKHTRSALSLESLMGKFLFDKKDDGTKKPSH